MLALRALSLLALALASSNTASSLFARQSPGAHAYPQANQRGPPPLPAWIATLEAAKEAGRIPEIPVASAGGVYPPGLDMSAVCSWTASSCFGEEDLYDAPAGLVGISFDDGPTQASPAFYRFLRAQGLKATHFFIGSAILNNREVFHQAVEGENHIAVHTWSHPYMTTLSDLEVLGELGWTSQITFDESGIIPAFWRPPYGDVDNRVRAIASEVFGLTTVIWNEDTRDYAVGDLELDTMLTDLYNGPQDRGLMILHHGLSEHTVGGFVRTFPQLIAQGWTPRCIPDLYGDEWYVETTNVGLGPSPANTTSTSSTVLPTSTSITFTATPPLIMQTPSTQTSPSPVFERAVGAASGSAASAVGVVMVGLLGIVLLL